MADYHNGNLAARPNFPDLEDDDSRPLPAEYNRDDVRRTAAKMYGAGFNRGQIARAMVEFLSPTTRGRPLEQRLSGARTKLKRWEADPKFRDLIWELGLIKLDLQSPKIMEGVARQGRKGRVDAARLAFELTGRHVTKGDPAPPSVVIAIGNGIPRPQVSHGDAPLSLTAADEVVDQEEAD